MSQTFLATLLDAATEPYRPGGKFAYHFARGKLGTDPIFRSLLRQGLIPSGGRILDLGCGQAVFASWLLAARRLYEAGHWPAGWPEAPRIATLRGIELMPRDVARAHQALGAAHPLARIELGDICACDFGTVDVVTILDVLHYIDPPRQHDVLRRVRAALTPGGRLILRIGDANGGLPFRISNWVDQVVTFVRGHRLPRLWCRPLSEWRALLEGLGFTVDSQPMSEGKPFANVMLVARLPEAAQSDTDTRPLGSAGAI
ncbi:class I SAM-dependent methyltransferase [Thauera chlorobenzoica]|uniref:SAM-dependent methyltransferase n=1 Tax=Thauera chlorobenzoica TaxID=96773 RepID=A0A1H5UJJ3_9RHOO|nr:class I SAM-dependent methyltransferase [Thauera chlorobenzoica]APR03600.1 SAM-dependent methyltransferase [Thauera chlorobenzoica]SEF75185.1 Methyltransferase domain-containing protein [Thauera chlorobenzoica]